MSEKRISRSEYYKEDYEGFAIFLITRAYNDLKVNTSLFNSLEGKNKEEGQVYFFKLLIAHLKETLRLLGKMEESTNFSEVINKWKTNKYINQIYTEIAEEIAEPAEHPDTVNAKYLNMRHTVFHYGYKSEDYNEYKKIEKTLEDENVNVLINTTDDEKYNYEIGVDIPISYSIFNEKTIEEVTKLKEKVEKLLREILNDYLKEKNNSRIIK